MPLTTRDDLILSHLWVVRSVASSLKSSLLFAAEWDELVAAGNLALVEAAGRFEARHDCQFRTYAYACVRGAMLKSFTRVDGHHGSARIQWCELEDTPVAATQVEHVYRSELACQLQIALAALKPTHRGVIQAEYFADRPATAPARGWGSQRDRVPFTEVARMLNCKRDRAMKWKRTALKRLRRSLTPALR